MAEFRSPLAQHFHPHSLAMTIHPNSLPRSHSIPSASFPDTEQYDRGRAVCSSGRLAGRGTIGVFGSKTHRGMVPARLVRECGSLASFGRSHRPYEVGVMR